MTVEFREELYAPTGSCKYVMPKPMKKSVFQEKNSSNNPELCQRLNCLLRCVNVTSRSKLFFGLILFLVFHIICSILYLNNQISKFDPLFLVNEYAVRQWINVEKNSKDLSLNMSTNLNSAKSGAKSSDSSQDSRLKDKGNVNHTVKPSAMVKNSTLPSSLKKCPPVSPHLVGYQTPNIAEISMEEAIKRRDLGIQLGGSYRPMSCASKHRVAIVVPYRDRAEHLAIFLNHIHPFLIRQQIQYQIFIVEQNGKKEFNRAMLMNVGVLEALKIFPFDCFIFHDVDLLPEDDRNLYTCPLQPRHMSVAVDTMKYKLPYKSIFGGVSALTTEHFKIVNGFSNSFWGWGGEDDDMSNRIKYYGFHVARYPANIARYTMVHHKPTKANPGRHKLLKSNFKKKKFAKDGLKNIKYEVLKMEKKELYMWILADLKK